MASFGHHPGPPSKDKAPNTNTSIDPLSGVHMFPRLMRGEAYVYGLPVLANKSDCVEVMHRTRRGNTYLVWSGLRNIHVI